MHRLDNVKNPPSFESGFPTIFRYRATQESWMPDQITVTSLSARTAGPEAVGVFAFGGHVL